MIPILIRQLWHYLGRILLPLRIYLARLVYHEPMFNRFTMRLDPWTVLKTSYVDISRQEAAALAFVRHHTSIPVPDLLDSWNDSKLGYIRISMCTGVELGRAWPAMDADGRSRTAAELKAYIRELRALKQPGCAGWVGSAEHGQVSCPRISMAGPQGPWDSAEEFHAFLLESLAPLGGNRLAQRYTEVLRAYQHDVVFSHADLSFENILVDPQTGRVTAIVDWAMAGWWPEYWEYRKAMFGGRTGGGCN